MRIRSVDYDLDSGIVEIGYDGGTVQRESVPASPEARATSIRRYQVDFSAGRLLLHLPNGRRATVELAIPGSSAAALLGARIVLYLDQNLWSRLAAARYAHRPVPPREATAAHVLEQLVADRRIILPVSAGHFLETARHRGPNRLPLASTLLELCGGWQMRHPGVIGATELVGSITNQPMITRTDIFTLEPNATFLRPFPAPAPRYPEPLGSILSNVIAATATYDTIIDPTALTEEGAEVRGKWAQAQDALVELLAEEDRPGDFVRRAALGRLLFDYAGEELRTGRRVDLQAIQSWLTQAADEVTTMPYLGRLWRLMFMRLRNGAPWSGNDLVDIHNLSAAAGYADVVAGEKRTIGELRSAKPVTIGARLATSLEEAAAAVAQLLARRRA